MKGIPLSKAQTEEEKRKNEVIDRTRVQKEIMIKDKTINAQVDTGSDISTIQLKTYRRMKLPKYIQCEHAFEGVGAVNRTLGYLAIEIIIDGETFSEIFYIIENQENIPEILIGLSLINQTEMLISASGVKIKKLNKENEQLENSIEVSPIEENSNESNMKLQKPSKKNHELHNWTDFPFINALIHTKNDDYPEVNHIQDVIVRKEVMNMIRAYLPRKVKESPIELKITLDDETPIYQRYQFTTKGTRSIRNSSGRMDKG